MKPSALRQCLSIAILKKRIVAMNDSVLHSDMRAVIANDLALGVGKELGITKAEIKKRLAKKQ